MSEAWTSSKSRPAHGAGPATTRSGRRTSAPCSTRRATASCSSTRSSRPKTPTASGCARPRRRAIGRRGPRPRHDLEREEPSGDRLPLSRARLEDEPWPRRRRPSAGSVSDPFRPGDRLPGGFEALPTARGTEVVYWLPRERALVPGDVLVGDGGVRIRHESWLPSSVGQRKGSRVNIHRCEVDAGFEPSPGPLVLHRYKGLSRPGCESL